MNEFNIPTGWDFQPLSRFVLRFESGVSVNSEDRDGATGQGGILKTSCVNGGRFDPLQYKTISRDELKLAHVNPRADSILVSRMNTFDLVGESAYIEANHPTLFLPDRLWQTVMRDDVLTSVPWLSFVVRSPGFRQRVSNAATGTSGSMKNISQASYLGIPVLAPPYPEQCKIAKILTTLDDLIEKTEALIAKYEAVKQGMMHDLFTRGVDEHGQLRPPHAKAPYLYKPSPLGLIPKEWDVRELQGLVRPDSPITYGVVQPGPEDEEGVLFVRGGDIFDGQILHDQLRTISPLVSQLYQRTLLRGGEVVVSLVGYPGEVAVVDPSLAGANIARQAALVRLAPGSHAGYITEFLLSPIGKKELFRNSVGSAQQVINLVDLKSARSLLAEEWEQRVIADRLSEVRRKIQRESRIAEKFRNLKAGLMHDLLIGKVRVHVDPTEEAADA